MPLAAGVGGGVTQGKRSAQIAAYADANGCLAVVLNAAVDPETVRMVRENVDIPVIYTVIAKNQVIKEHIEAGADILNISGCKETAEITRLFRERYPHIPIIATGGKTDEQILQTIDAGANAYPIHRNPLNKYFKRTWKNTGKIWKKISKKILNK